MSCRKAAEVRAYVKRIIGSRTFKDAGRLQRFLVYIVESGVAGQTQSLKEFVIGLEVFGKPESFDPRLDAIVRVQAGRLRAKLKRYYETEGREDAMQIEIPIGSYVPVFTFPQERQHGPANDSAYDLYLRGRYFLSQPGRPDVLQAAECFESAIARDPRFILSYLGLAASYTFLVTDIQKPAASLAGKAREAAERASRILLA